MNHPSQNLSLQSSPRKLVDSASLRWVFIGLIVVGIVFRFVNLNHKIYWHDEAYTSMRSAGYTRQAIDQELFQNRVVPAADLQRFQQIKPQSAIADTIYSLAIEDPQHPPLYFVMSRFWVQWVGPLSAQLFQSSITAWRLLPALLSLLALPLMYALAWELFASRQTAWLATTLLALSPFDVLFAQTARQYSLLTVLVIGSQVALLRALRLTGELESSHESVSPSEPAPVLSSQTLYRPHVARSELTPWLIYGASVTAGLYTQPFFGLTLIAQSVYVGLEVYFKRQGQRELKRFGLSVAGAIALYLPWIWVMVTNSQRVLATTDWATNNPGFEYLLKLWTLSFTALFVDLDFGFNSPLTYGLRLPFVVLMAVSLYYMVRRCRQAVALSVITSIAVPFMVLVLPDLVLGSKRSAVSRYLISCFPGIQLAIAHLLSTHLSRSPIRLHSPKPLWRMILITLCAACLLSLATSAAAFTWWNKDLSYFNFAIAQRINATPNPIVISDIGDDFTNTGDLIALSYNLKPGVNLVLLRSDATWVRTLAFQRAIRGKAAMVFRPSKTTRQILEQMFGPLQPLIPAARLWKIPL